MPGDRQQPYRHIYRNPIIRLTLLITGILSAILGFAGIFIPLLPTTPFLLLSTWCFVRSSEKANQWLLGNRFLGPYIRNYKSGHGITIRNKVYSLVFLWVTIIVSMLFSGGILPTFEWYIRSGLLLIGVAVSIHILRFRTLKEPTGMDD